MGFRVIHKVGSTKREPAAPLESDQDLIRQAQRGDQQAMSVLYSKYRRKVLNYLYRFTADRGRAEELTQETFLRVVQNLHRYRPTGSVAGWIYRIAGNLALNALRDHPAVSEVSLDEPISTEEGSMDRAEAVAGAGPQPDEEAVRMEREDAVQRSLMQLSPHHREVLILCDIEQYSYREAAETLRCPMNTVASRLARARAQMAELLGYLKGEQR